MIRVELTTDEIDALDEAIDDPEFKERYGKRLLALKMHALGVPNSKIRDHDFVSVRTTGSINAETICELLKQVATSYPGEHVTLVMDNTRYQRNAKVTELAESLGIELLYLPPYSPNLNLIERVWKLVKSKYLRNRYHENFAGFTTAIDEFIDSLSGENRELLRSLITENFQLFPIPKT